MKGLYIHIPFCVRKCSYCDFYSLPDRQSAISLYIQAVLHEAQSYAVCHSDVTQYQKNLVLPPTTPDNQGKLLSRETGESRVRGDSVPIFQTTSKKHPPFRERPPVPELRTGGIEGDFLPPPDPVLSFQTLYIGGGTPSLLGPQNLQTLITGLSVLSVSSPLMGEDQGEGVQKKGAGLRLVESTLEANPESATPEFLQTAKTLGFNRLSFGVQSLSDAELQSVGRIHTAAQAVKAVKLAQKTGFQNISADLIIGLPGQTWHSLHNSLEALTGLGLPHLSVYCLSLETGTPLALNPPSDLPSDDAQAELFEKTRSFLLAQGFVHYEISNYARPGFECRHNLNYWRGGEYLGLGPAAASHLNNKRFKNKNDLDAYLSNPTGQIEYVEELNPKEKAAEEAMLRLRLLEEGVNTDELTAKFGPAATSAIILRLDKMAQEGLLLKTGPTYRLSPAHILTSNSIFSRVLSD
jgi:oxygen-independent coproporphyrinogen III oxidase